MVFLGLPKISIYLHLIQNMLILQHDRKQHQAHESVNLTLNLERQGEQNDRAQFVSSYLLVYVLRYLCVVKGNQNLIIPKDLSFSINNIINI